MISMLHIFSNQHYQQKLQQLAAHYNVVAVHVSAGGNLVNECNCDLLLCYVNILTGDWTLSYNL